LTIQHSLRRYLLLGFTAMLMLCRPHLGLGRVDRNLGRGDRAGQAGGRQQRQEGAAPDGRRGRHPQRQGRRPREEGRHRGAARRDAGRASFAIVTKALDEMEARQARLEAERDGANKVTFAHDLRPAATSPRLAQATTSEQRLFELRRSAREGQKAQLLEQIDQLRQQIVGNDEQVAAKTTEIDWNQQELGGIRTLWKQNLVPFNRVTTLERDSAACTASAAR
jgi:HlyD family secretion protein